MLDLSVPADISRPGVVACALYRDGRRVRDVTVEEIGASAGNDGEIVWLGLHEPDGALLGTLQAQLGLHELMIEDANQAHQRAKLDIYDNVLFIALRTAQLDSKGIHYGETHLIVGKGFVVSIRHGASASYAEVRQRCERNPERSSTRSPKNSKLSRRIYSLRCLHGKRSNAFIGCAQAFSICAMR